MQENEFEKRIRQKMDGFTLVPEEDVWKVVAAKLQSEKKRKRVLIYLFSTLLLLITGLGGWFYLNNTTAEKLKTDNTSNKLKTPEIADNNYNSANKSRAVTKEANSRGREVENNAFNKTKRKEDLETKKALIDGHTPSINKRSNEVVFNREEKNRGSNTDKIVNNLSVNNSGLRPENLKSDQGKLLKTNKKEDLLKPIVEETFLNKTQQNENLVKEKSTVELAFSHNLISRSQAASKDTAVTKDTIALASSAKEEIQPIKILKRNKIKFGFSVLSGMSDNLSGLHIFNSTSALANGYYSTIPGPQSNIGSGATGATTLSELKYSRSFSYGFGFYLQKQMNQKLFLTLGLNYSYYSTKSRVGSKSIIPAAIYDSVLDKSISRNEMYQSGSQNRFQNKYYMLEVPVNLLFRLNKNQEKPITFSTGFSLGYLFNSNALYANYKEKVYYVEKDQFRRFQLIGQGSIQIPVIGSKGYNLSIGPALQYGFTNMAKPVTSTKQHLVTLGLKGHLLLK